MQRNPSQGSSTRGLVQALVITAVAILLVGGACIGLLNTTVNKLQTEADNKQAQVGSSQQVADRYQVTLSSYNDTINRLKYLETSVTDTTYVPTLLQQIQALAQTTKLQVLAIRPGSISQAAPPKSASSSTDSSSSSSSSSTSTTSTSSASSKKAPPYDTLGISLDINGTYPATAAFLYDLTRFPKIIAVTSANMHPNENDPGTNPLGPPMVHTTLQLTAYLFHDDSAPAPIPGLPPSAMATTTDPSTTPISPGAAGTLTNTPAGAPAAGKVSVVPATVNSASFTAAAQRAVAGATGASKAVKQRAEVGVGTL